MESVCLEEIQTVFFKAFVANFITNGCFATEPADKAGDMKRKPCRLIK